MAKLVFGFDIDGVLTFDDDGESNIWLKKAAEYFQQEIIRPSFYIEEAFERSSEEVQKFFRTNITSIFRTVPVRPKCSEILQGLWRGGHTIHLITARDGEHRQVTKDWLNRHNIPYHSLTMSPPGKSYCKGECCVDLEIDFFVDDKLENARDVSEKGIYTLLFNASHNLHRKTTIPRVNDWLEIDEHINSLLEGHLRLTP